MRKSKKNGREKKLKIIDVTAKLASTVHNFFNFKLLFQLWIEKRGQNMTLFGIGRFNILFEKNLPESKMDSPEGPEGTTRIRIHLFSKIFNF